jgi:hypothetical protein
MPRCLRLVAFDFRGPAHPSAGIWRHEHEHEPLLLRAGQLGTYISLT